MSRREPISVPSTPKCRTCPIFRSRRSNRAIRFSHEALKNMPGAAGACAKARPSRKPLSGRTSIMRDKVVVITGGFGVLGHAVAEAALAAGAFVAVPDREQECRIPAGDRLLVLGGVDLTDFAAATRAFETVATRFGKIDGLANI